MTSFLVSTRSLFKRLLEKSLLKEPQPDALRSLFFFGYISVLLGCTGLALIGFSLAQYYLVPLTIPVLVGLSVLVRVVADLVFERDRALAVRLRVMSLIATVLAYAALLPFLFYALA